MSWKLLTQDERAEILRLHAAGYGYTRIASKTGLIRNRVRRFIEASDIERHAQHSVMYDAELRNDRSLSSAGKGRPSKPAEDRFQRLVKRDGDCLVWQGGKTNGYGIFSDGGSVRAHVWAYRQAYGEVPNGLELDHVCRNRACVNVDHLEPVTPKENWERSRPYREHHLNRRNEDGTFAPAQGGDA